VNAIDHKLHCENLMIAGFITEAGQSDHTWLIIGVRIALFIQTEVLNITGIYS
jgi:hypothetical protein